VRVTCERAAGLVPPRTGAQLAREYGLSGSIIDALTHHLRSRAPTDRFCAQPGSQNVVWDVRGRRHDTHRHAVSEAAKLVGFPEARIDEILATVPQKVLELAKIFARDVWSTARFVELSSELTMSWPVSIPAMKRWSIPRGIIAQKLQLEQELRDANVRLERLASVDELTGILNRRALEAALHRDLARADRDHKPFSALLLDIDHFSMSTTPGDIKSGDAVLTMVGDILNRSLRTE